MSVLASARPLATLFFMIFVGVTLAITLLASRRNRSKSDYYTASSRISGIPNGLAIAGDYTSAATFLGVTALVFSTGYDGMIYAIGFLVGFPLMLFLVAEPLRNLGRFTIGDVVAYRLGEGPLRVVTATSTVVICVFYLVAQIVGGGKLIQLLFGVPYAAAVVTIAALMLVYVAFGGMLATTWVQITKAVLLLVGSVVMATLILGRFGFDLDALFRAAVAAHPKHLAIMAPGGLITNAISTVSLGMALIFGTAGLPHILMRFFTVPDARQARTSIAVATGFIAVFYSLLFVLGFGAIAVIGKDLHYHTASGAVAGGDNMVALYLAHALAGAPFMGFIAAVAFATILAVVSGLTIAGASALSHDLYARVLKTGADDAQEVRAFRTGTVLLSTVAVVLALAFERQNIAFLVGLVFAIAASANFPLLILTIFWRQLTTPGAIAGATAGLIGAVVLVILSPAVWVTVFGQASAPFPYTNPALFSIPLAFVVAILVSLATRRRTASQTSFNEIIIRSEIGALRTEVT
jgi:cation/acetate symporter